MSVSSGSMAAGGGSNDLLGLALIAGSDPDFRKRLQELNDAKKAADQAVLDLGVGKSIKKAQEALEKDKADFAVVVEKSKALAADLEAEAARKAADIVAGAEAKAKAIVERAEANAASLVEKAEKLRAEAEAAEQEAKADAAATKAATKEIKALKASMEAERKLCLEKIHNANNESQRMQSIAAQLRTILEGLNVQG